MIDQDVVQCTYDQLGLYLLSNLNQVSLEAEARQIAEVMTRVANKLAEGGGARMVSRDVLDAKKMLNGMGNRLEL